MRIIFKTELKTKKERTLFNKYYLKQCKLFKNPQGQQLDEIRNAALWLTMLKVRQVKMTCDEIVGDGVHILLELPLDRFDPSDPILDEPTG